MKTWMDEQAEANKKRVGKLMEGLPPLVTCKQAQGLLNLSRAGIYSLMDKGHLERVQFSMSNASGKKGRRNTVRITNTSIRNLLIRWLTKE